MPKKIPLVATSMTTWEAVEFDSYRAACLALNVDGKTLRYAVKNKKICRGHRINLKYLNHWKRG